MDKRAITMRSVAISAVIILVLNPQSLLSPGFQMSFAAVTAFNCWNGNSFFCCMAFSSGCAIWSISKSYCNANRQHHYYALCALFCSINALWLGVYSIKRSINRY